MYTYIKERCFKSYLICIYKLMTIHKLNYKIIASDKM